MIVDNEIRDLIDELNLWEEQYGTEKIYGRCTNASEDKNLTRDAFAFHFDNPSDTSVATSYIFPNGFPSDFSILMVIRQLPGKSTLNIKIQKPNCIS